MTRTNAARPPLTMVRRCRPAAGGVGVARTSRTARASRVVLANLAAVATLAACSSPVTTVTSAPSTNAPSTSGAPASSDAIPSTSAIARVSNEAPSITEPAPTTLPPSLANWRTSTGAAPDSRRWLEVVEAVVRDARPAPPEAARLYAYAAVAYADALAAGAGAVDAGRVAVHVLLAVRPDYSALYDAAFAEINGRDASPPLAGGLPDALAQVVNRLAERASNDGSATATEPNRPDDAGLWEPEPGARPAAPEAGSWSTWLVPAELDASSIVSPPPSPGSPEQAAQLEVVRRAIALRDAPWAERITFWGGAPGTNTPSGIWQDVLWHETEGTSLAASDVDYARAQAALAETIADAFIATWKVKFTYWTARPDMVDRSLRTAMPDPPFPGYVSGHSAISAAAAVVLSRLVPAKATVWMADAGEARDSRLMAGIHFPIDNAEGFRLGLRVGALAADRLGLAEAAPGTDATPAVATAASVLTLPSAVVAPSESSAGTAAGSLAPETVASPGDHAEVGALVELSNPAYDRSFLVVAGSATARRLTATHGWTVRVLSGDGVWTPNACGGSPTAIIASRWVAYVEVVFDPVTQRRSSRLVSFDLRSRRFRTWRPADPADTWTNLAPTAGGEVDIDVVRDATAVTTVDRLDLATGAVRRLTLDADDSARVNRGEVVVVHGASGLSLSEVTASIVLPVDGIAPWVPAVPPSDGSAATYADTGDIVFVKVADGSVHARIHAYRVPAPIGWSGAFGYLSAYPGSKDAPGVAPIPGVYDVRSGSWDWAIAPFDATPAGDGASLLVLGVRRPGAA